MIHKTFDHMLVNYTFFNGTDFVQILEALLSRGSMEKEFISFHSIYILMFCKLRRHLTMKLSNNRAPIYVKNRYTEFFTLQHNTS